MPRHPFALGAHRPLVVAALGASTIIAGGAVAAAQASAQDQISARVVHRSVRAGQRLLVVGHLASNVAGRAVELQYRSAQGGDWQTIASTTTGRGGAFRLGAPVRFNGAVRVIPGATAQTAVAGSDSTAPSAEQAVTVHAAIGRIHRRADVLAGRSATVRGTVVAAGPGRPVALQASHGHGWRTVDRSSTFGTGQYRFRLRTHAVGSWRMRVAVSGTPVQAGATRAAGRLNVYRQAFASWYGPGFWGGHLACGGTLEPGTLGVANKSLPCGSWMTLRHGSHTVRVQVIDRGPYVAGREFDLTAATRARLHFPSTGEVLTTAR